MGNENRKSQSKKTLTKEKSGSKNVAEERKITDKETLNITFNEFKDAIVRIS